MGKGDFLFNPITVNVARGWEIGERYVFIEMQRCWLIRVFCGSLSKIRGMESKFPYVLDKLNLSRQSKAEIPHGF